MVEVETVLVLGAGASVDYGFPAARDLLDKICDMPDKELCNRYQLLLGDQRYEVVREPFFTHLKACKLPSNAGTTH
jgi:hypothetical protein